MAIQDTTPNFSLELPHPDNHMAEDCMRIRNALIKLDSELKKKAEANAAAAAEAKTAADNAKTAADNAQKSADGKLDKAGGVMTGPIAVSAANLDRTDMPAKEIQSNGFLIRDKSGDNAAHFKVAYKPDGTMTAEILAAGRISGEMKYASIESRISHAGDAYATCPPPRGLYNNDIVTMKTLMDYAPEKLTSNATIHVGGANASDTAALFQGRGLSADKPFATLTAAVNWVCQKYPWHRVVTIILHDDIITGNIQFYSGNIGRLTIKSDSTVRTINITGTLDVWDGNVSIENVKVKAASSISNFFSALGWCGNPTLTFSGSITFTGTVTLGCVTANMGGKIIVDTGCTLAGSVTGPRYKCSKGSCIITQGKGPNAFPGTSAGTCDASSVYA